MGEPDLEEPLQLASFGSGLNAAVIGATGGIGRALAKDLAGCPAVSKVYRLSRSTARPDDDSWHHLDLAEESSIANAASALKQAAGGLHVVLIATGILHDADRLQPEKSWQALSASSLEAAFRVNAVGPALVAKHFLPLLATGRKSAFAALSARVGSIGDNQLGGWHSYRASKAALNMLIKTLSIELARRNKNALCVGLHPGTVDTALSRPFQRAVADGTLFAPRRSARHLLNSLDRLTADDTGFVYAWDGSRIPF